MTDRSDPFRPLRDDADDVHPVAAAAIRERGDRIRRRRHATAAAGAALAVVLVAVPVAVLTGGAERSGPPPVDRPDDSAPADPAPSTDADGTVGPVITDIPERFPLLGGWPRAGGDVSLSGPSPSGPSVVARACGRAPEPPLDVLDRLAAQLRLPAESRTREVLLYAGADAAQAASAEVREIFEGCPRDASTGVPVDYVTTVADEDLGDGAWVARSSFDNPDQPGRAVFVVVRVDNALLLESVTDEGRAPDELATQVVDALVAPLDSLAHLASADVAPPGSGAAEDAALAAVPLDLNLRDFSDEGPEFGIEGPGADAPGVLDRYAPCGDGPWDGGDYDDNPDARRAVTSTGPEFIDSREVRVYADASMARAALTAWTDAADAWRTPAACPADPGERTWEVLGGGRYAFAGLSVREVVNGTQNVGMWHFVRSGRAILAMHSNTEMRAERNELVRRLMPSLCPWSQRGC